MALNVATEAAAAGAYPAVHLGKREQKIVKIVKTYVDAAPVTTPAVGASVGYSASLNVFANNFVANYAETVSSATPIVLTAASAMLQSITGSTAQTITLPVTSTMKAGHIFEIYNPSSATVTVNSSGGNQVFTVATTKTARVTLILASGTSAASWNGFVYN